jgi:hypothetical protein
MKAITIWQPWASLIAIGAKKYETRSWATRYTGPIAIHAAKIDPCKLPLLGMKEFEEAAKAEMQKAELAWCFLPTGSVIATAWLKRCEKIEAEPDGTPFFRYWPTVAEMLQLQHDFPGQRDYQCQRVRRFPEAERKELLFGDWTPGRYAWEFKNMKVLDVPIPVKGAQRIWNWEPDKEVTT